MGITVERNNSTGSRAGPFLAAVRTIQAVVTRLTGFFVLTEADKLKAGIYIRGVGRDD